MKWKEWKEEYLEITRDFGFNMQKEKEALKSGANAAMKQPNVLKGNRALLHLSERIGERCIVVGAGPSLQQALESGLFDESGGRTIVAADGACGALYSREIIPDIIVTDADGDIAAERKMNAMHSTVVLHFHGDNYPRAYEFSRSLTGDVIITTQAGPTEWTFNFGGFTDGDRAVLLCEEFGAESVLLAGFDLPTWPDEGVPRKLLWAKRIILEAEERGLNVEFFQAGNED
jgi:uncharacterized Rossmann fold enzyme